MPARLTPLEPPTPQALVTGDPRRAFSLARELTAQPKMSHQARGLWGYTGISHGGLPVTVQSTGIGGPSAAVVLADLAATGVRTVIRLGTCIAPATSHPAGRVLLIESAIGMDGASTALRGMDAPAFRPDPGLHATLEGIAPAATASSHDFAGRHDPEGAGPAPGASARDLQTAVTFALAGKLGLRAAGVLVVAGEGDDRDLGEATLSELLADAGRAVLGRLEEAESNPLVEG